MCAWAVGFFLPMPEASLGVILVATETSSPRVQPLAGGGMLRDGLIAACGLSGSGSAGGVVCSLGFGLLGLLLLAGQGNLQAGLPYMHQAWLAGVPAGSCA